MRSQLCMPRRPGDPTHLGRACCSVATTHGAQHVDEQAPLARALASRPTSPGEPRRSAKHRTSLQSPRWSRARPPTWVEMLRTPGRRKWMEARRVWEGFPIDSSDGDRKDPSRRVWTRGRRDGCAVDCQCLPWLAPFQECSLWVPLLVAFFQGCSPLSRCALRKNCWRCRQRHQLCSGAGTATWPCRGELMATGTSQ